MLSRVADNLYWMSRYIERSEGMARMIQVHQNQALEYVQNEQQLKEFWRPVLQSLCAESVQGDNHDIRKLGHSLIFSQTYANSIFSCISFARENARMVRDQLSEELWLELNNMYLSFRNQEAEALYAQGSDHLLDKVTRFSLVFQGLADATIPHGEGWRFLTLGKYLERADQTSRMLDTLNLRTKESTRADLMSVLSCCIALSAFRQQFRGNLSLPNVANFLLFSEDFPRSIRFCIRSIDHILHSISGVPAGTFSNEAEKLTGSTLAMVNFTDWSQVRTKGLHETLDEIQSTLIEIGQYVFETYVLLPSEIKSLGERSSAQFIQAQQQQ